LTLSAGDSANPIEQLRKEWGQLACDRGSAHEQLLPFVENAFKHGIGLVESPLIQIEALVSEKEILMVTVKNKYNRLIQEEEKKPPGIGLVNLKKRLDLIYPGNHQLEIMRNYLSDDTTTESWFTISLNISLQ